MGDDPSSGDEPVSWASDGPSASEPGGGESATWSPDAFEPVKSEFDPAKSESPAWAPDEHPTTFDPIEQQRTMALEEPQAWSKEHPQAEPAPWAQDDYQYTERLPTPPPQYPPQYPPPAPASGSSARMIAIALAVVAAVAAIAVVAVIALRKHDSPTATGNKGSGDTSGKSSEVTKCNTPPTFSMTDAKTTPNGLTVKLQIKASCSGGDVLSSSNTTIGISTSDGRVDVASGRFDLSSNPIFVPRPDDGSVDQQFVFGPDSYWMPLGQLGDQYTASSPGYRIQSSESPPGGTTSGTASTSSAATYTATGPAAPSGGSSDTAAGNALRAIADADTPVIQRDLAGRWVPQLSSKKVGDDWDGIHWDNAAILREHLNMRQKFNARLAWSNEWSTYTITDMWVTSAGSTFQAPDDALGWCTSNGFDRNHCYAKIISKTLPPDGTTKLMPS